MNMSKSAVKNDSARLYILKKLPMSTQYRIDFTNNTSHVCIGGLKLYYGFVPMAYLNGEELFSYIAGTANIEKIETADGRMYFVPQNENPSVYFDSKFARFVNNSIRNGYFLFSVLVNVFIVACFCIYVRYRKKINTYIDVFVLKYRKKIITVLKMLCCISLMVSAGLVVYIAIYSDYGIHPDETVSKMAIDFYLTNWIPPDIRNEMVANTFSNYGHSRLEEMSVYYFLAGKVGFLFKEVVHSANYYRIFNICLYLVMCFVVIKKIWKESWLIICSAATPQLCYIFSYATSDAWDYFCSFLLFYQIAVKDSMLNKALDDCNKKRKYAQLAFFGVLAAFIFMGKASYYIVLLLAFLVFLFKLIKSEALKKRKLIMDYIYILLIFSAVFMTRYSFNMYYYGLDQAKISAQVREERADYQFKNATPMEEKYFGLALKDRGVPLEELFNRYSFLRTSYESFCGVYGGMVFYSDSSYYYILGIVYALVILILIENTLNLKTWIERIEYMTFILTIPVSVFLSIYHSWTGDLQPQGRYLLPMLIGIGYLASKIKSESLEILFLMTMSVACIMVPYGFYEYGVLNMI